jgi:sugar O-acyltransferase (sialic acid O-acetyltransferase NeuD family)
MKPIAIYGAGGLGREMLVLIHQINEHMPLWDVVGFIDDGIKPGKKVHGLPVIGGYQWLNALRNEMYVVAAIGEPATKKLIIERISNPNVHFPVLIHPQVPVRGYQNIQLGEGTIITNGNILTTDISIGKHVLLNLSCTIGHDVVVGDYCSLMPGCHISGDVKIGEAAYVGTGAALINGVRIRPLAKIGAGAVVVNEVEADTTVVGIPARPIKKKSH